MITARTSRLPRHAGTDGSSRPRRVVVWHVHGSYLDALVRGRHRYLLPVLSGGGEGGRRPEWPERVVELTPERGRSAEVDVVIAQRPGDLEAVPRWLGGRRPGRDVACVYLEHNVPQGRIESMRHPLADRGDLVIVHVTHFNDLLWDCGSTPTRVIEHGVPDPGHRYTGELPRIVAVINEARRRGRVTGTDLLPRFAAVGPLDLFGIDASSLGGTESLPPHRLHAEMCRRRLYLHPNRWTSLGLSLIEAMLLGMPVVAVSSTEAASAVPAGAGFVSTDVDSLVDGARQLLDDPVLARAMGGVGRRAAAGRFGLDRFLAEWDDLLAAVSG